MFEVEIKAFILNSDLKRVAQFASSNFNLLNSEIKQDIYYSNKEKLVRIRTTGKDEVITFKNKSLEQNVEINKEFEFKVSNLKNFLTFIEEIGFKILYEKTKRSLIYKKNSINVEINEIDGLGSFLEVEKVVENEADVPQAKEEVLGIIKLFNLQDYVESKSYFELLNNLKS